MEAPAAQGGDRAAAQAHAEQLEKMDPVYGVEARCMVDDASDRATVKRWQAVVAAHPKRADAHKGLAKALLNADDFEQARAEIDEAIRLDPSNATLLFHLCRSRAQAGKPELARDAAQQYLDRAPAAPAPLRAFASFYIAALEKRHGDAERAEELLAAARRVDPHCWTTVMEPPAVLFESP
jgi:Flp pilus assembly protein TadD